MHTSDYVIYDSTGIFLLKSNHHFYGGNDFFKRLRMLSQIVVLIFKTVKTETQRCHPGIQKRNKSFLGKQKSIGHNSPVKTAFNDFLSGIFQIAADKRFSACYAYGQIFYGIPFLYVVQNLCKVFNGHFAFAGFFRTVTPAVQARKIAPKGTLPEKIIQPVIFYDMFPITEKQESFQPQRKVHIDFLILRVVSFKFDFNDIIA